MLLRRLAIPGPIYSAVLLLALPPAVLGQEKNWNVVNATSWTTGSGQNWNPTGIPGTSNWVNFRPGDPVPGANMQINGGQLTGQLMSIQTITWGITLNGTLGSNSTTTASTLRLNGPAGANPFTDLIAVTNTGNLTIRPFNSGTAPLGLQLGASGSFNVTNAATTLQIDSVLSESGGARSLTKLGAGTVTLTGADTYTGTTTVSVGTLKLSGSGSIATSPTITVASGATFDVSGVTSGANFGNGTFSLASGQRLEGNGTVTGAVNVASGSTLAPGTGAAIGQLAIGTGTATSAVQGGGKFEVEIAGNNDSNTDRDQLNVTGALDLRTDNGGATVVVKQLAGSVDATMTHTYTIATTTTGVLVNGSSVADFTGVNIDASAFASPGTFSLSRTGMNLILTFTPVPEPAAALVVFAAGVGAWHWRRKRCRSARS
jgi:autotransporter-associated beta strand protein